MLYYIIYIINAVGARFIVFVPDFIASAPIFTSSPQGLELPLGVAVGEGVVDNLLTAIYIAVGQGSGMGVMTPSPLAVRGMVVELRGKMVEVCGSLPEGIVKLISRCEIVIANRDIMISHRETVISNPETKIKPISVRMMAVGDALSVGVVIRVCFHVH